MRLVIMQPYFLPYAGYFRLFTSCDLFVLYDCVQFPARGWVHRNQVPTSHGLKWLTLPLAKCAQQTPIQHLHFQPQATVKFRERLLKFPNIATSLNQNFPNLHEILLDFNDRPIDYLERTLSALTHQFNMSTPLVRSSALNLPEECRGQDRIIEICRHFRAKEYINLPNGRTLYQSQAFAKQSIHLSFLPDYVGPKQSILVDLVTRPLKEVIHDINIQSL